MQITPIIITIIIIIITILLFDGYVQESTLIWNQTTIINIEVEKVREQTEQITVDMNAIERRLRELEEQAAEDERLAREVSLAHLLYWQILHARFGRNLPGDSPGVAAHGNVLLQFVQKPSLFQTRAASRTCRLWVFKEVHLMISSFLETVFKRVHWRHRKIFLRQTVPAIYDPLRIEL